MYWIYALTVPFSGTAEPIDMGMRDRVRKRDTEGRLKAGRRGMDENRVKVQDKGVSRETYPG